MESDKHSEEAVDAMALRPLLTPGKRHPELMGCKRNAMHHSPKYKIPRSAMPQAAQEHGNDEIGILANFPPSGCLPKKYKGNRATSWKAKYATASKIP